MYRQNLLGTLTIADEGESLMRVSENVPDSAAVLVSILSFIRRVRQKPHGLKILHCTYTTVSAIPCNHKLGTTGSSTIFTKMVTVKRTCSDERVPWYTPTRGSLACAKLGDET
jgi:hypothetical protein